MKLINFNDPKVMAYSGLIAMLPKTAIALIFSLITALLISKPQAILALMVLWYPVVGSLIDLQLYKLKDKLWNKLPTNIPELWDITPEQLLTYAKYLPKLRLIRFLIVFIIFSGIILELTIITAEFKRNLSSFDNFFDWLILTTPFIVSLGFILLLIDKILLKKLNITKPLIIMANNTQAFTNSFDAHNDLHKRMRETDPTNPSNSTYRELSPAIMGSITWISNHISPWK